MKDSRFFYLATPYSHINNAIRERRFLMACEVAGFLLGNELHVYSPIAHTHPIAVHCDLPKGFDFWKSYDTAIIKRCTDIIVVMADGWKESMGVRSEIEIAQKLNLGVHYMWFPDYTDWFATAESTLR